MAAGKLVFGIFNIFRIPLGDHQAYTREMIIRIMAMPPAMLKIKP